MTLAELGLTPSQLAEIEDLEPVLVEAWLSALSSAHGLRSPVGWFLAGVRSGIIPGAVTDNARIQAERYIRKVGYLHQTEDEIRDELASRRWPVDDRLVEIWRSVRPLGVQVEREQLERAERWKQAHLAMHGLGTERTSDAHHAESEHSSHSSLPLTRVSAPLAAVAASVDADIDW